MYSNSTTSRRHKSSENQPRRRSWCCSFTTPPCSPQNPSSFHPHKQKSDDVPKLPQHLSSNSPQNNKFGLVGRILSPGRVSPIDDSVPQQPPPPPAEAGAVSYASRRPSTSVRHVECNSDSIPRGNVVRKENECDVRMNLKGKDGGAVVLELNSEVLCANSSVFAHLIGGYKRESSSSSAVNSMCRIEVPEIENVNVFRETIELMFEVDMIKYLQRIGTYRSIHILEVAAGINFTKGVSSCLKYLEAVPWSEEDQEKLKSLFTRVHFDDMTTKDIFARLYSTDMVDSPRTLARQLVSSITNNSSEANARTELKSLVKGLLLRNSVYRIDHPELTKEDVYAVCKSCLSQLVTLFEEASGNFMPGDLAKKEKVSKKSVIERVSIQVDNINWLLEILINWQMADEFVDVWAEQKELLRLHENASPMIRYELSRVSAILFIAMGTRKLYCRSESRLRVLQAWFGPMLLDFGWLQRCRKGLNIRALEEGIGQALLTLPLRQQYIMFMDWFSCFSKHGTECPNLSKAFQIWWRRSFAAGSESNSIDIR